LLEILAPHTVTIEHASSNTIPNQAVKPIIDMFASVQTLLNKQVYADLFSNSGYHYL